MSNSKKIAINGSDRIPLPGARAIGRTDPHQLMQVSVILTHHHPLANATASGKILTHSEFAAQCGANPAHVDKVRQFAKENNLYMLERGDEVLRRTVTLAGTAAAMEKAFDVELSEYEHPDGSYRGRVGAIHIPEECAAAIQGVFGLDDRPMVKPHFRYRGTTGPFGARASDTTFTPTEVAKLYDFPQDVDGTGQTIGLIEFGGGYRMADVQQYFKSLKVQEPTVSTAALNLAKNRPTTPQSADTAVMLDIELAGAAAPGSNIVVYFAPNTSRGVQDVLSMAVHDQLRGPRVLSISWGSPESSWTGQSMQNIDEIAQEAALLGITIIASCGDNGASDGVADGQNHVDFPASSPHVLAVGATRLLTANGVITSETVWNDGNQGGATGGGFSTFFASPDWQTQAVANFGRGVPDVVCNADPDTGYEILVDGQQMVVGGTSAAAPLWAGLITLLNQKLQTSIGFINPSLYEADQSICFRQVSTGTNAATSASNAARTGANTATSGNNAATSGSNSATTGWNPVAGLGSPRGIELIHAQHGLASQTTVNTKQTSRTDPASHTERSHH